MVVGRRLGRAGPEQADSEQAHDRRGQGDGRRQHQSHAHDQAGGEGAQGLKACHQERRESRDHGRGRRGDHDAHPTDRNTQSLGGGLAAGDVLAMAEQEENDVVGAHTEHHDQEQGRQLGSDLKAEPVRQGCRDALGYLMNGSDDHDRQDRDCGTSEHQSEQDEDQDDGRYCDDGLRFFVGGCRVDADRRVACQLAPQAGAGQVGVGLGPHEGHGRVGTGIAGLALEHDLNELDLLVFGEIGRRGRD